MLVSMDISVPALLPPSLSMYHSLHHITYHIGTVHHITAGQYIRDPKLVVKDV